MKLKVVFWSFTASLILPAVNFHPSQQPQRRVDLTIVYTNDVLGEIEPCG